MLSDFAPSAKKNWIEKTGAPHWQSLAATPGEAPKKREVNVESVSPELTTSQRRLRAMIEIIDGQLKIYPVAQSDTEAAQVLHALRFVREDFER
jgi:hypothetical protein